MFVKRLSKTVVSMLAATLVSALLVVGCSDDDDDGVNGNGGGGGGGDGGYMEIRLLLLSRISCNRFYFI